MTEQQYRLIADRDKGDDPQWEDVLTGDRATSRSIRVGDFSMVGSELVRIERPVPIEPCLSTARHLGHEWGAHEDQPGTGYWCPGFDASDERPVPTTDSAAGSEGTGKDARRDGGRSLRPGEQLGTEHQPSSPIRQPPGFSEEVPGNWDQIKHVAILLAHIADPDSTVTVTEFAQAEAVLNHLSPHPPTREQISSAIGEVLFNASNYPRAAMPHILGRDIGPLRNKVTDAVLALLQKGAER